MNFKKRKNGLLAYRLQFPLERSRKGILPKLDLDETSVVRRLLSISVKVPNVDVGSFGDGQSGHVSVDI